VPVSFLGWKDVLAGSGEAAARQGVFTREIIAFLRHCKQLHCPASIEVAKQYLAGLSEQARSERRDARGFNRSERKHRFAAALNSRSDCRARGSGRGLGRPRSAVIDRRYRRAQLGPARGAGGFGTRSDTTRRSVRRDLPPLFSAALAAPRHDREHGPILAIAIIRETRFGGDVRHERLELRARRAEIFRRIRHW
jgi:hypothetical protein